MGKGRGDQRNGDYFKMHDGGVADSESKQALARQRSTLKRRAGRKTRLGEAPPEQRAKELSPAPAHLTAPAPKVRRKAARRGGAGIARIQSIARPLFKAAAYTSVLASGLRELLGRMLARKAHDEA